MSVAPPTSPAGAAPTAPAAAPSAGVWLERSHDNALNCLRLIFAGSVLFSHAWALAGLGEDPISASLPGSGGVAGNAVNGFFLISGFLITGSWFSRRGADAYLRARILRIWPAFAVALVISALLAAVGAGHAGWAYLSSIPRQNWITGIFTLNPFVLERPLSFAHNPYPHMVNGPMWTIRIEFSCYLAVAFAGAVGWLRRRGVMAVAVALSIACATYNLAKGPDWAWQDWSRFASYFGAGTLLYLFRREVPRSGWLALACAGILCAYRYLSIGLTGPLAGTYLVFYCAYSAPGWIKAVGSRNDISYGVYLYGGILQQLYYCYAAQGRVPLNPWVSLLAVTPLCVALGWASWLFIEKPAKQWFR